MEQLSAEPVVLVGIREPRQARHVMEDSIGEMYALIDTAGGSVAQLITQELKSRSAATLIHKGKVEEIADVVRAADISCVVMDADLSPAQHRNLSDAWGCKVIDRTALILDIFAGRAQSQAGKLQVELAQLEFRLPRLAGSQSDLMQQAGHIGTRGPGETRLEIDRRRIRERIARLKKDIAVLQKQRATQRMQRARHAIPVIALVGYTNAGKSTILNALSSADVLAEDQLFATLDPTARRIELPSGRTAILVDTVGFISHLPHQLVAAFRGTFEEVVHADILLHVCDAASAQLTRHREVVTQVLHDLGTDDLPCITVWNKCDLLPEPPDATESSVGISALDPESVEALRLAIDRQLDQATSELHLLIPHTEGSLVNALHEHGHVLSTEHRADGIAIAVRLSSDLAKRYGRYVWRDD